MNGSAVEIVATDVNILDRKFPPFSHIRPPRAMCGCVLIEGKIAKYTQKYVVQIDNVLLPTFIKCLSGFFLFRI